MREQISFSESVGRTIEAVALSNDYPEVAVIAFTDGTFATLSPELDFDDDIALIGDASLDLLSFGDAALIRAGIATEDEINSLRNARHEKEQNDREAYERRHYEHLKRKFSTAPATKE